MSDVILSCKNLCKSFHDADKELKVLQGINFQVDENQLVAIIGSSGSGKSTLLHLLGGLDTPTNGEIFWHDENINLLSEKKKCRMRNKHLGFVYQFHHLLPEFTALENAVMPLLIGGTQIRSAKKIADDFLRKVDLSDRKHHKIGELSGGERQRIAIVRALVTQPKCILADEPTGNLDGKTAEHVLQVMLDLQRELGTSFVIVTHDLNLAKQMQVKYELENGKLNTAS
ncbi:MAG: lipoprotein-releasing ABC transporter ATP-binding protein LolD [Gammaproteobacteria bacterium]|jgi:lipoprotein-releasing system ATP-binding protein